jgi:hypothetical protein
MLKTNGMNHCRYLTKIKWRTEMKPTPLEEPLQNRFYHAGEVM